MRERDIINNLRVLSNDVITNAKSGHPGVTLSAAPIFYAVFKNLKTDRENLKYFNRDFFISSAGHASALHYSTLHLFGLGIEKEDLKNFRRLHSKTPGHPEISTPGIDCSTGPLGQGVANSVGFSLAIKHFQALFNKPNYNIINNYVYCFLGDGCLMEGVSNEAFSLASALKLNNLIYIYDRNNKTIEGSTNITYNEDIVKKFKALNFNVFVVKDGNNIEKIEKAIKKAKKSKDKPNLIIVDTLIGFGSHLQDNEISHGKPFSESEVETLRKNLGVNTKPFEINAEAKNYCLGITNNKHNIILEEKKLLEQYKLEYPKEYETLMNFLNYNYNDELVKKLKDFVCEDNLSTREINHKVLNFVAAYLPNLIGGAADVNKSTLTYIKDEKYINEDFRFRNIHYGVREHAMCAVSNGMALHGGLLPFCSCYLSFIDYCKNSIRMSAMQNLPVMFQLTHDDIFVGEDGPTHQPVEQLVDLRATPNLTVFRPYNLTEVLTAYDFYLINKKPTALILSKSKLNNSVSNYDLAKNGGYILKREENELDVVLIATGSQVNLALKLSSTLKNSRVVSMPSLEVFDNQSEKYKSQVLPKNVKKVIIEALSSHSFINIKDDNTLLITNDNFGASGKSTEIEKEYKFDFESVLEKVKNFLK